MVDGLFLVASNELPMCSVINHAMYKTEWEPFTSRCEIVETLETDFKCGTTKFPYTVDMLAKALRYLSDDSPVKVAIEKNDSHKEIHEDLHDEGKLILESHCGDSGSS